jgi:hypothetical protein
MKKPIVAKCLASGDYDHRYIKKNVPYICIFLSPPLGIEPLVCVMNVYFSHLYNSTLESTL